MTNQNLQKLERFVFNQTKKYFDTTIKQIIEQKGRELNLWNKGSKLTLKLKAKKVGYNFDEVSTKEVANISELKQQYDRIQWGDDGSWDKRVAEYYALGMEKYGKKNDQICSNHPINEQTHPSEPIYFLSFSERRKRDDFSPVKFKDFKV